MHEYHAVESVLKQIIAKAEASNAIRISKINLVVGELLGFEESSLRLYFENATEDTIAAGAQLNIR